MKITTTREALIRPIQMVTGVIERRQTLPVLANCKLSVGEDGVWFTGTDLEIQVTAKVESCLVEAPGVLTVSGWKLLEIVRALREESEIVVALSGEKLQLSSGRSRFSLSTLPVRDFPGVEETKAASPLQMDAGVLQQLLGRSSFAMAHQDLRYYLNGLLLELRQGQIRAVATDGHRLACTQVQADITGDEVSQVIVPRKAVQELERILREASGSVEISLDRNHFAVRGPGFNLISKLIEGKFPDYQAVIPPHDVIHAEVEREEFRQALNQAAKLANERYLGVRLAFSSDRIVVSANNPDQESAEIELAAEFSGEPLEIGFNVQYLLDAVTAVEADKVQIWMDTPQSSIRIEEPGNDAVRYVVMPMML